MLVPTQEQTAVWCASVLHWRIRMRRVGLLAVLFGPALSISHAAAVSEPAQAWRIVEGRAHAAVTSPAAVRAVAIEFNEQAITASTGEMVLSLFEQRQAYRTTIVETRAQGRYTWRGQLKANPDYVAFITVHDGHLAGLVNTPEGAFELRPTADGNLLVQLDQGRFDACGGAVEPGHWVEPAVSRTTAPDPLAPEDSGDDIKVLVMYSPAARDAAGGVAQIAAQAQAAVDSANTAFVGSGMRMRFATAGIELLDGWVEGTTSASTELGNFRANATAQERRNALNADLVSLLVAELPGACGIGYVMRTTNVSFAPSGYQLTDRDCAVGNLSWAHEHGHNVGFEHDPANGASPASASRPWSFGHYVESGTAYRTVMSYQCPAGNCTRQPRFSNPRVTFNGAPTGIEGQRDNARTGDAVADTVASFRMVDFAFRSGFE